MLIQISEFPSLASYQLDLAELPDGPPARVTNLESGATFTVGASIASNADSKVFLRLRPVLPTNITWANGQTEGFDGVEFRALRTGDTFSVGAA